MRYIIMLIAAVALSACVTERQERAATTGAVVGAAGGAVVGSQTNSTAEGAIIGGALGAAAGILLTQPRTVIYQRAPQVHQHRAAPERRIETRYREANRDRHRYRED